MSLNTKCTLLTTVAACVLIAAANLSSQSEPLVYFGPYEQPSVDQFAGEWTRSDGTYKMVISVEAGKAVAQYFNPAPINVESTTSQEARTI